MEKCMEWKVVAETQEEPKKGEEGLFNDLLSILFNFVFIISDIFRFMH